MLIKTRLRKVTAIVGMIAKANVHDMGFKIRNARCKKERQEDMTAGEPKALLVTKPSLVGLSKNAGPSMKYKNGALSPRQSAKVQSKNP